MGGRGRDVGGGRKGESSERDKAMHRRGAAAWANAAGTHAYPIHPTPRCTAYVGSLLGTLYAALMMHSYLFSIIFCIAQARPVGRAQCCWARKNGAADRLRGFRWQHPARPVLPHRGTARPRRCLACFCTHPPHLVLLLPLQPSRCTLPCSDRAAGGHAPVLPGVIFPWRPDGHAVPCRWYGQRHLVPGQRRREIHVQPMSWLFPWQQGAWLHLDPGSSPHHVTCLHASLHGRSMA